MQRTRTDFTKPAAYSRIADRLSGPPRHVVIKPLPQPPTWRSIAVGVLAVVALWTFLFALDAGLIR